jgi:predicted RNase H-like nuclease (RuvC/YqgF family)
VFQEKVLKLEEHSTTDSQTKLLQITTLEATVQELKADKAAVSQQLEESQTRTLALEKQLDSSASELLECKIHNDQQITELRQRI